MESKLSLLVNGKRVINASYTHLQEPRGSFCRRIYKHNEDETNTFVVVHYLDEVERKLEAEKQMNMIVNSKGSLGQALAVPISELKASSGGAALAAATGSSGYDEIELDDMEPPSSLINHGRGSDEGSLDFELDLDDLGMRNDNEGGVDMIKNEDILLNSNNPNFEKDILGLGSPLHMKSLPDFDDIEMDLMGPDGSGGSGPPDPFIDGKYWCTMDTFWDVCDIFTLEGELP